MWRRAAAPSDGEPHPGDLRAARIVTLAATALFLLLVCRWRPWDLFDRAGFSADFYDEQARVFIRGRLHVDPAVPGPEGFLIDGRTYLYYGPLLALARVPVAIVGAIVGNDQFAFGRLTRISLVLGYVAFLTACFRLVRAVCVALTAPSRADRGDTGVAARRIVLFVAAAAASPVLFLAGWVSVYHETEMWAAVFAVWVAVGALRTTANPTTRNAAVTAAAVVAATLTRAPIGIGMGVGVGVVALMHLRDRDRRRAWVGVIGGCIAAAVAHVAVNVAKFGTLLDLPADRQLLTLQNPGRATWFAGNDGSFFSLRFLPTTVAQYLRPDAIRFERLLPIVRFGPPAPQYGSYPLESTTPTSSLTATASLLAIAAVAGVVILLRRRMTRMWTLLALTAGGALAAAPTFAIGFIGNRYLVDMLPMLLVPAAAAFVLVDVGGRGRRVVVSAILALVAWGAWSNVALATWVQNLKEPGFTEWRYEVDGAVFGEPSPGIVVYDPGAPVPRNGIVALDLQGGACRSVYVAEDARWNALEHSEGFRRLTGELSLPPTGDAVVADGEGWQLVATAGDGTVRFRLGDTVGAPVEWDGGPLPVRVVSDDVEGTFRVTVGGREALFAFTAPPLPMRPGPTFVPTSERNDRLCTELAARR